MNKNYRNNENSNKVFVILIIALSVLQVCHAQDVIVLKDGSTILSKVTEVGKTELKYKKWSNIDGPNYVLSISDILSINYQNGEKEIFSDIQKENKFNNSDHKNSSNTIKTNCKVKPEANNSELINAYNSIISFNKENESKKNANYGLCKFGVTCNSVLSSKDIEVTIERLPKWNFCCQYGIVIKNKKPKTIYVDLGNSFKIESNNTYEVFFDNTKQISVHNESGNRIALGMGSVANALGVDGIVGTLAQGVTLGKKSESSVSTSYSNQRILVIPPFGKCFLSEHKEVGAKKNREYLSHGEQFIIKLRKDIVNRGGSLQFTEYDSPWKQNYIITYSDNETFSTYNIIEFEIYIQQILGTKIMSFWGKTPNQIVSMFNKLFNINAYNIIENCIFSEDIQNPTKLK